MLNDIHNQALQITLTNSIFIKPNKVFQKLRQEIHWQVGKGENIIT